MNYWISLGALNPTALFILVGIGLFLLGTLVVILLALKRSLGCQCHSCGGRMNFFDELTGNEQAEILGHFRNQENREPDRTGIFTCPKCLIVYDDFSGEKRNLEGDSRSLCKICGGFVTYLASEVQIPGRLSEFLKENPLVANENIECLQCRRHPESEGDCVLCDTPVKLTGCSRCHTLYRWMRIGDNRFQYLVALTDKPILKKPVDDANDLY